MHHILVREVQGRVGVGRVELVRELGGEADAGFDAVYGRSHGLCCVVVVHVAVGGEMKLGDRPRSES
ncbi:hypothetical protein ACFX13_020232 [Malus domestica]